MLDMSLVLQLWNHSVEIMEIWHQMRNQDFTKVITVYHLRNMFEQHLMENRPLDVKIL